MWILFEYVGDCFECCVVCGIGGFGVDVYVYCVWLFCVVDEK